MAVGKVEFWNKARGEGAVIAEDGGGSVSWPRTWSASNNPSLPRAWRWCLTPRPTVNSEGAQLPGPVSDSRGRPHHG